ncbi:hypothetical protein [Geobacter sp.]|nr:hypothetical protein [Geobacter sp.]
MSDFKVTTNDASETKVISGEPVATAAQPTADPAEPAAPKGGKK